MINSGRVYLEEMARLKGSNVPDKQRLTMPGELSLASEKWTKGGLGQGLALPCLESESHSYFEGEYLLSKPAFMQIKNARRTTTPERPPEGKATAHDLRRLHTFIPYLLVGFPKKPTL
jgi:hypothetical protein